MILGREMTAMRRAAGGLMRWPLAGGIQRANEPYAAMAKAGGTGAYHGADQGVALQTGPDYRHRPRRLLPHLSARVSGGEAQVRRRGPCPSQGLPPQQGRGAGVGR